MQTNTYACDLVIELLLRLLFAVVKGLKGFNFGEILVKSDVLLLRTLSHYVLLVQNN